MARCASHGVRKGISSVSCASRRMGWRDAPLQNASCNGCNGYLRVAQNSWRGAQTREIVQISALIEEN
ncbi:hypothetical protein A2U01_0071460, partial [Trifolium medium]|nr:hypothetical protein [Trifolium medium]